MNHYRSSSSVKRNQVSTHNLFIVVSHSMPNLPSSSTLLACITLLLCTPEATIAFAPRQLQQQQRQHKAPISFVGRTTSSRTSSRRHGVVRAAFKQGTHEDAAATSSTAFQPFWKDVHTQVALEPASASNAGASNSYNAFQNAMGKGKESRHAAAATALAKEEAGGARLNGIAKLLNKSENTNKNDNDQDSLSASNDIDGEKLLYGAGALIAAAGLAFAHSMGLGPTDLVHALERFVSNPQDTLQEVVESVQAMGPLGPLYFGIIYLIAEILAIPATPLTMSAGYLFGLTQGVSVVLLAATIAASVSFFVGKTFLRSWVETILQDQPKFAKIDKAIAKDGFKLLLLVRLSPIFPFALSNYLYGASAIDFASYFWGTLLGFTPGTFAYVYTGMVGKALTLGEGEPWYIYAGGFSLLLGFLKIVTDVATNIVEAATDEEETV